MKTRLLGALVGLAISAALPTYAQQKDLADPQTTEKIAANLKAFVEAHMKNDAAAVAALFTRDAVDVTPEGPIIPARRSFCQRNQLPFSLEKRLTPFPHQAAPPLRLQRSGIAFRTATRRR